MPPKKPVNKRKKQWGKALELVEPTAEGPLTMRYFDVPSGLRNKMRSPKSSISGKYVRKDAKGKKWPVEMYRLHDRRKPKEKT